MFGFSLFTAAQPTDRVFKFVNGRLVREGDGVVLLCGPRTTVAVVPTTVQPITFTFRELTSDGQQVVVQGQVFAKLIPDAARQRHDFSVVVYSGAYRSKPLEAVREDVARVLQTMVRPELAALTLKDALVSAGVLQQKVLAEAKRQAATFATLAVTLQDVFITSVEPGNLDLKKAMEAETRERLLAGADKAMADRRMANAENDRQLKEYEGATALQMEQGRSKLVAVEIENQLSKAKADAASADHVLSIYKNVEPRVLMALGIKEMASGNVGQVNFTPEFLTLVAQGLQQSQNQHQQR